MQPTLKTVESFLVKENLGYWKVAKSTLLLMSDGYNVREFSAGFRVINDRLVVSAWLPFYVPPTGRMAVASFVNLLNCTHAFDSEPPVHSRFELNFDDGAVACVYERFIGDVPLDDTLLRTALDEVVTQMDVYGQGIIASGFARVSQDDAHDDDPDARNEDDDDATNAGGAEDENSGPQGFPTGNDEDKDDDMSIRDEAFEVIAQFYGRRGWQYVLERDKAKTWARVTTIELTDTPVLQDVYVSTRFDPERLELVTFARFPYRVPPEKRMNVLLFLSTANLRTSFGNFDFDVDDGKIRFKTTLLCKETLLLRVPSVISVEKAVLVAILELNRVAPAILELIFSDMTPAEAIAKVTANGYFPDT